MVRICAVGDCLVDRYLDQGLLYPGGSAANAAVNYRRLGASASFIGIIGGDEAGRHVRMSLESEGVDVGFAIESDDPSSFTDVAHDESGNRKFLAYLPPSQEIVLGEAQMAHLAECDWVHTGHTSFIESQLAAIASVCEVVFDFSHCDLDFARPLLPDVSVAVFSRTNATDAECFDLIDEASFCGPSTVVITRGELGAVIRSNGKTAMQHPSAASVARAVDTLGAGDAFIAALMTSLKRGDPLTRAAELAGEHAAQVCRIYGGFGHARPIAEVYSNAM